MSVRNPVRGTSSAWALPVAAALATFFIIIIPGKTRVASRVATHLPDDPNARAQSYEAPLLGDCNRRSSAFGDLTIDFLSIAFAAFWRLLVHEPERH